MHTFLRKVKHWFQQPDVSATPESDHKPVLYEVSSDGETRMPRHGSLTISDNQVIVVNPEHEGSFATMTIPSDPRLTVTIDGQECIGRVFVHQDQDIRVSMTNSLPSAQFSTNVSADSMTVTARVDVIPGKACRLKDMDDVHHALLEIQERYISPQPLELSELTAKVEAEGYLGEIDNASLALLARSTETTEVVILQGTPPIHGRPPCYKAVDIPKLYDPLRRRMMLSTVPIGSIVAIFEPEIPGVPGRDVFGHEVPVREHRPLPALGAGVIEVNGQVVASRNGRVVFTKSRIDVVPELVIHHDLSSKDGKIEFDGNVTILGTVLDGSSVKATGSVEVHGSVLCSTILAERGVFVAKTIVGSQILVGQSILTLARLHAMVKQCLVGFYRFRSEYTEVAGHVRNQYQNELRLPLLADVLLSKRHPGLVQSLTSLADDSDHVTDTDERYRQIVVALRSKWTGIGRTNILEQDVIALQRLLEDYVVYVESITSAEPAEVKAGSVTSSSIRASGNIVITGSGIYASSFESGDSIVIRGTARGGFLVAESSVRIYSLGTASGTESSVKVNQPSGKIVMGIRHPNTLLQVGNRRDRNLETQYKAVFRGEGHANKDASRRRLA